MKRLPTLLTVLILLLILSPRASAVEITPPEVPESGRSLMPNETATFGEGVLEILKTALPSIRPDLAEASKICAGTMAVVLLLSLLQCLPGSNKNAIELAGAVAISCLLLAGTKSMLHLGARTVNDISEYGKLLLPVMTAALAAQGGVTTSAALYTCTAAFNAFLTALISKYLIPMIRIYLALAVASGAIGERALKQLQGLIKWSGTWCLKIILYAFTGFLSITGVVSGSTDAAALKAAKLTISGMVPVVGSILSDASEAVLVSADLAKNAAGIYGILAILAVFLMPFLQIGVHYLLLKLTAGICSIFGPKRITDLIHDLSSALGMLLAMTGSECILLLISTVCFLRGVG